MRASLAQMTGPDGDHQSPSHTTHIDGALTCAEGDIMSDQNKAEFEGEIVTLAAREGNRFAENGECVATHMRYHLVFMPNGCKPGQEYRVQLASIGKNDKNGRALYRAVPAPILESERWVDNKDGTISRCRVLLDWKLQETVKKLLTRPKKQSEVADPPVEHRSVTWGVSQETSRVIVETTVHIALVEEAVYDFPDQPTDLRERVVSRRAEPPTQCSFPIQEIHATGSPYRPTSQWYLGRLLREYPPDAEVQVAIDFGRPEFFTTTFLWQDLPVWVQEALAAPYPVCVCGRARVSTPEGHTTCGACQREAAQLAVVNEHLPLEKRRAFAKTAVLCTAAAAGERAWQGEMGADLVIALTSHVPASDLASWKGYPWYYYTTDGIFASRFPPAAMMILSHLGEAEGGGLVTLAAWLTSHHKASACAGDFFARTQESGEDVEAQVGWPLASAVVAVKLRGTDAELQEALALRAQGVSSQDAENAFARHDYADAVRLCHAERARLEELRRVEEAERLAQSWIAPAFGGACSLADARTISGFAEEAARLVGAARARDVFHAALHARYGREGRQSDVRQAIPGLDTTWNGEGFFTLSRARDVDAWLRGAVAYFDKGLPPVSPQPTVDARFEEAIADIDRQAAVEPRPTSNFTFLSPRQYRCGACRATVKLTDPEWNRFRNTGKAMAQCSCGQEDNVFREETPATKSAQPKTATRPTGNLQVPDGWKPKGRK